MTEPQIANQGGGDAIDDRARGGRAVSLERSQWRERRRLRALEQLEDQNSALAALFTLVVAPLGFLIVLAGALLRLAWSQVDRWLERRSAAQYHRRRQASRASKP